MCDYDDAAKMDFLRLCHDKGVRNIEMESLQFGAFTQAIGAKAGVIAVALLNRFEGDGVLSTPEQLLEFDGRPARVVCALLKARGVGGGFVRGYRSCVPTVKEEARGAGQRDAVGQKDAVAAAVELCSL